MFLRAQLTIYMIICSDNCLASNKRQAIAWTNVGLVYLRIYVSLGLNELKWQAVRYPMSFCGPLSVVQVHTNVIYSTRNRTLNPEKCMGYFVHNHIDLWVERDFDVEFSYIPY